MIFGFHANTFVSITIVDSIIDRSKGLQRALAYMTDGKLSGPQKTISRGTFLDFARTNVRTDYFYERI
jgi:hypothetical protein